MNEKEFFMRRLSWLIKQSRISQTSLANALNISRPAIGQFLAGVNSPSMDTFTAIANFFGVRPDYLLGADAHEKELLLHPDGELYYHFARGKEVALHGAISYSFGIAEANTGLRKFICLSERTGGLLLNPTIIHGQSHLEFLSLVALLNARLNFQYNPFEKSDCDIVFPYDVAGSKYHGIICDFVTPPRLIEIPYSSFLETYLSKTTDEKILHLSAFIDLPALWPRED